MAGRRRLRRGSDSTVATVDEQTIQYTKESQIIRAAPPGTQPDDWPCFLLTEAIVYNKHGQMANLLCVDLEGPFMIRGIIVVDPDQKNYLMRGQQKLRSTWIEISRTCTYSIGLKEDSGTPVIWAAGEAAHFELIPSDRYAPIANVMFQGIIMHYNIYDLYEAELEATKKREQSNSKQKRRKLRLQDVKLPLDDIFYKYAAAVGDGSTLEEVRQRCKDQAGFLLAQFPRDTSFHAWLSSEFPDIVQQLRKKPDPSAGVALAEPEVPAPAAPSRTTSNSTETRGSRLKSKVMQKVATTATSRGGSRMQVDPLESGSDEQRSSRNRSAKAQRQVAGFADVDMQDFAHKPLALPARSKTEASAPVSSEPQSPLLRLIEVLDAERQNFLDGWNTGAKQKKHPDTVPANSWLTKVYLAMSITNYQAKSEVLQYHARGLTEQLGTEWHNSELYAWLKEHVNAKPKYEHITEEQILRIQRRQKNPNIHANKAAQKAQAETGGKQPPRGRPSGKAAGLRPSLGAKKRPRSPDDDEDEMDVDEEVIPRKKTAKILQYFDNGEDEEEADDSVSSEPEDGGSTVIEPFTRVVIHAEPLSSTRAKGPNHTWSCEEPDCAYIVRSADDEQGQKLIRQHFELHEREASDEAKERELSKVNLAMQEGSRGHLPINHLLEKIRKANSAANKTETTELNGHTVPQPIKRSLLV